MTSFFCCSVGILEILDWIYQENKYTTCYFTIASFLPGLYLFVLATPLAATTDFPDFIWEFTTLSLIIIYSIIIENQLIDIYVIRFNHDLISPTRVNKYFSLSIYFYFLFFLYWLLLVFQIFLLFSYVMIWSMQFWWL